MQAQSVNTPKGSAHQQVVQALGKSLLFKELNKTELERLAERVKVRGYFPGETIVWEGKPSDSLYLIVNGIVSIKKVVGVAQEHVLAYLLPGMTFGEVGILENQTRSASVAALSDVEVLVMSREVFLETLHQHAVVGIELARLLGRYLVETSRRQSQADKQANLILLFSATREISGSTFGQLIGEKLAQQTKERTLCIEYIQHGDTAPEHSPAHNKGSSGANPLPQPAGYDLLHWHQNSTPTHGLAGITLLLDKVLRDYTNVVVHLPPIFDDAVRLMFDHVQQVILMAPAEEASVDWMNEFTQRLRHNTRADDYSLFRIVSCNHPGEVAPELLAQADYTLPYLPDFPETAQVAEGTAAKPAELDMLVGNFVNRLERTQQIGVYIPTTISVDTPIDASIYVERSLDFMAKLFGGATSKTLNGTWNSNEAGVVKEEVYLIYSYVTAQDVKTSLSKVVQYVKDLKAELQQEAMALEVNKKLTFI